MSLVAAAIEQRGIVTVVLSVLPEVSHRLTAPRTLVVPFGLGTPVGPAHDRDTQAAVVAAALALAADPLVPVPVWRTWAPISSARED
ncbi:MAG: hypothetical protein OEW19_13900 [Acidobacteriota bacterium]|nr:hypothetical protein [Acidobacteriota bacterium]